MELIIHKNKSTLILACKLLQNHCGTEILMFEKKSVSVLELSIFYFRDSVAINDNSSADKIVQCSSVDVKNCEEKAD